MNASLQNFTVVTSNDERGMTANVVYNENGEQVYVDCSGGYHKERFNKEVKRLSVEATSFSNALNIYKGQPTIEGCVVRFPSRTKMPKAGVVRDKTCGLVTRFELFKNDLSGMTRYCMLDQSQPNNPIMTYDTVVQYYEMIKQS